MTPPLDYAALAKAFLAAQLAGDRRSAVSLIVESAERGASIVSLQADVIAAAQTEIGRLWQANKVSIAQEHLATSISQLALARLFDCAPHPTPNGKLVYVACVQGEMHDMPARLFADFLDHAGFSVRYFGPDVPTPDLVASVQTQRPDLLALSVTMSFNVGSLRAAVTEVRAIAPDLPIAVGGHAVRWSDSVVSELGVVTAPSDPTSLIEFAKAQTGLA